MKTKQIIKIKVATLLFVALIMGACGPKEEEAVNIPEGILNHEQLTKVLTDFALAESAANMNIKNVPNTKFDSAYAFNPLFENNIRKSQYDSTIKFYVQHPALYKKVYENVLANLTQLQTKRNAGKDSVVK